MRFGKDLKGVIFDIDGVLLDSLSAWKGLGAKYLRSIGVDPKESSEETVGKALEKALQELSIEEGAAWMKKHYGLPESEEEIVNGILTMIRDAYVYEIPAKNGAKELLEALEDAGARMTAATAGSRELAESALERNGLLRYLETIVSCSEIGESKRTSAVYDAAVRVIGTKPKETCVVEDSLYALKTAAAAGYHTVGVQDLDGEPDQKGLKEAAELYVTDLASLLEYF